MNRIISIALASLLVTNTAQAHEFGFAGILSNGTREELAEIVLSAGQPISDAPIVLKSGAVYELEITSDGSGELALEGSGFFRAIWVNEVVINDLEIRPLGLESVEFDYEGTMEIEFLAIKPGRYYLRQPGSSGEEQRVETTIQ